MFKKLFLVLLFASLSYSAINSYVYFTPAGAGAMTGANWANAFEEDSLFHYAVNHIAAGDVYVIADGTYTMTASINATTTGTATAPIVLVGVKAGTTHEGAAIVKADLSAYGANTDRPLIAGGSYLFQVGNFYILHGLNINGDGARSVQTGENCTIIRCTIENDYPADGNAWCVWTGYRLHCIGCDFSSAHGNGILADVWSKIINCYFHDFRGVDNASGKCIQGGAETVDGCRFFRVREAYNSGGYPNCLFKGNSVDSASIAVELTAGTYGFMGINNVIDRSTSKAFLCAEQTDNNYFEGNHGDDTQNTDMWDGVEVTNPFFADNNVSTGDPLWTDPTTGDFSLGAGSPCLNSGEGYK
jgi:hypothetical protein